MPHVTFIHGIGNKTAVEKLHEHWLRSLTGGGTGLDLRAEGVTTSMVYWADVMYGEPAPAEDAMAEAVDEATLEVVEGARPTAMSGVGGSAEEAAFMTSLAAKLGGTLAAATSVSAIAPGRTAAPTSAQAERIPLPWPVKEAFLQAFLRDVHHYLFNTSHSPRQGVEYRVRDEIRRRFVDALAAAPKHGPHVVVSHSMGTVIAYDCLKRVADCPAVNGLMTIGSPLGLDEIQDKMAPDWTRANGFPTAALAGDWVNVFDRLDPVAGFDPFLADDFEKVGNQVIRDIEESNSGWWRHDIGKYLGGAKLRKALADLLSL